MLLLDGQVHHDTHAVPMGNYVIGVGNYVIATPSQLGNYLSADTPGLNRPARTARNPEQAPASHDFRARPPQPSWEASPAGNTSRPTAAEHDPSAAAGRDTSPRAEPDASRGSGATRRLCAWCSGPIPARARRDAICCGVRCRQARHRFLRATGPAGPVAGGRLLRLARPGVRVAAWHRGERPNASRWPLHAWEPVIYSGGRQVIGDRLQPRCVDSMVCGVAPLTTLPGRVIGAKPAPVCRWIFDQLGARPDDTLDDLFPGSGAVTRAWPPIPATTRRVRRRQTRRLSASQTRWPRRRNRPWPTRRARRWARLIACPIVAARASPCAGCPTTWGRVPAHRVPAPAPINPASRIAEEFPHARHLDRAPAHPGRWGWGGTGAVSTPIGLVDASLAGCREEGAVALCPVRRQEPQDVDELVF